jgi:hypothetical protein
MNERNDLIYSLVKRIASTILSISRKIENPFGRGMGNKDVGVLRDKLPMIFQLFFPVCCESGA